ncbi:DUF2799 domain-containing protein [Roseibium sp.]|uniref:DUF2799 domain-containing protein n=1 Tax=Roseibium sp. TaxID=1936156 RepID=UPI003BB10010
MWKTLLGSGLLAAGLFALGGCAAVTKEQCVAGDWADLGKAHASVGKPTSHLDEVVKSCGKHGITPDTNAYLSGWHRGVQNYCTPLNGFTLGKQYKTKSPICPPALASRFEHAYQLGFVIWTAENRVDDARSEVRSLEDRLDRLEDDLTDLDCKSKTKKDDRKECRKKRKRLRGKVRDTEYDLRAARDELEDTRIEAEIVTARINAEAGRQFGW